MAFRRRRRARKPDAWRTEVLTGRPDGPDAPETPAHTPGWSVGVAQGQGARDYQEDSYAVWADQESGEIHVVLADGMGGAEDGAAIAEAAVETARLALAAGHSRSSAPASLDPAGADAEAFSQVVAAIGEVSRDVWARHREAGGATLIACRAWADRLWFAAVGDSSLFLRRADRLFELNRRHEHRLDLWRRVLNGALPLADAEADPQVEALTSFIGCERLTVDRTAAPIMLEPGDTLLVCSDGVSDTLAVGELRSLLGLEPRLAADAISHRIEAAAVPGQDNYTAVVARHNQPATTERPV